MRGTAAETRRSVAHANTRLVLDVFGRRVELSRSDIERLQEAAGMEAGSSSIARDLSLLLADVATGRTIALRRIEARLLGRLATNIGMGEIGSRITTAAC